MRYGHCHRVLDFLLDPLSSCTYPGLTIATSSRNSRVMRSFRRLSLPVLRGLVPVWFRAVWTCATKTTTAHSCLLSWLPRAPSCCFLTTDRLADTYTTSIFHSRSSISLSISVSLSSTTHTTPQSFFCFRLRSICISHSSTHCTFYSSPIHVPDVLPIVTLLPILLALELVLGRVALGRAMPGCFRCTSTHFVNLSNRRLLISLLHR